MTLRITALLVLTVGCGGDQKLGVYNSAPVVSISSPPDGTNVDEGVVVQFEGLVSDAQTDSQDLQLTWSSDIAGILTDSDPADATGLALYSTGSLEAGNHAITLSATDESGERTEYTMVLTVVDVPDAPTINVVHPTSGESGEEGELFGFVVQVSDQQDAPADLVVTFESDVDGVFCTPVPDAIGVAECDQALSAGDHRLTFKVTDSDGLPTRSDYYFTVISTRAVDNDGDGWTEDQGDCDDGDASVRPGATEYYNERDDDCDGVVDEGTAGYDDDGDGQSELEGDCNDASPVTYQGATEICDGYDNDCDGIVDETTTCYDDDGDGYTESTGDCNDASAVSYPGAPELEDGLDNDCDGAVDEGTNAYDDDGDGYSENDGDCNDANASIHPAGTETCNGYDDDCDGTADERDSSGCFTYYYDYDGDSYGSTTVSGRCLCAPSDYYTSATNTDCYDYNASANPSATAYYTTSRGDGNYDYNCASGEEKRYTTTASCSSWPLCDNSEGWRSSPAVCGATADWQTDCGTDWTSCDKTYTSRTQSCK